MARRYCGDVTIFVEWKDKQERYRCVVSCAGASNTLWVGRPAAAAHAVDSSFAYDDAARAALSFAMEGSSDHLLAVRNAAVAIADAAAADATPEGYLIHRRRPK